MMMIETNLSHQIADHDYCKFKVKAWVKGAFFVYKELHELF